MSTLSQDDREERERAAKALADRILPMPRPTLAIGVVAAPVAFMPEHVHVAEDRDQ